MIYGIGTDITEVHRFEKWVSDEKLITRYFNPNEVSCKGSVHLQCEHLAARFAAKEAFTDMCA